MGDGRTGVNEVLAVIQEQQHLARLTVVAQLIQQGTQPFVAHAQRRGDGLRDQVRVCQPRQVGEPDAITKVLREPACHFQAEPRLARSAGAGQRQQPGGIEQAGDLPHLALAANEAGELCRQVVAAQRPVR